MSKEMQVMVLGGGGMLGHKLSQVLSRSIDVTTTFRRDPTSAVLGLLSHQKTVKPVDATDMASVQRVLDDHKPDVVVNCIGVIKQLAAGEDPVSCIAINALFPNLLAKLCQERGMRLICISTDCVFSGRKGGYTEEDTSDASDLYGRTKYLGEVVAPGCLTIRTSIIGRELSGAHGLVEWFLSQNGRSVKGFSKAIFSGFTTLALSRIIGRVIADFPNMQGLYHVAADPIPKHELLGLIRDVYGLDIHIEPDDQFVCDRSLDGGRFCEATGMVAPSWREMIEEMHADPTPYDLLRKQIQVQS